MTVRIRTEDGAVGKAITAKRKKINGTEQTVCSLRVQMTVNRREFEQLAGFPDNYCDHFYTDEGMPLADMSLLLTKLQLDCNGKITHGGVDTEEDDNRKLPFLPLKNAVASDCRFVPEPNTAVFICKLSWLAEGDEVEEVSTLLGAFCDVDLTFAVPAEQKKLDLGPGGADREKITKALQELQEDLALLEINIPEDHALWQTMSPIELKRVQTFVLNSKAGKKVKLPAVLKPLFKREGATN